MARDARRSREVELGTIDDLTVSSLDVRGFGAEIRIYMARFRTILTTLIVCALAALPAANASAAMRMAGTMGMTGVTGMSGAPSAMSADCDEHAAMAPPHRKAGPAKSSEPKEPCSDTACGGKCLCVSLAVTGVLAMPPATLSFPHAAVQAARLTANLRAPSFVPPSPPPRV